MLNFDFVLLHVADPLASAGFYSDVLGKPVVDSNPGFAMLPLSDKVMLGLWRAADAAQGAPGKPGASEVSFNVADMPALERYHADWLNKGIPILVDPVEMPFGHTFVASDPDGHRVRVVASINT